MTENIFLLLLWFITIAGVLIVAGVISEIFLWAQTQWKKIKTK